MKTLDPKAHALALFRILPNGEGRKYTATTFPANPWAGCERFIRTCYAVGMLGGDPETSYAVLDVIDADHDIVQDFPIPNANAFQWIKKKLDIAVLDA